MEPQENINIKLRKFAFTKWVNYVMHEQEANEIVCSIADGHTFLNILKKLRKQTISQDHNLAFNEHAKFGNMRKAFEIMKNDGLKFAHITPQDVVTSPENLDCILEVVWALIVRYHILHHEPGFIPLPSDSHIKKIMLTWINSLLPDPKITNFASDWSDGSALLALLEYCENRANHNWVTLKHNKKPGQELLVHCLSKAEERLGIPDILGGRLTHPGLQLDEYALMTYLAFYTLYSGTETGFKGSSEPKNSMVGPVPVCVLEWVNTKLEPVCSVQNWRGDWVDGKALQGLVNSFPNHYIAPCPGDAADRENIFKGNHNFSILEESINKAKELGVQPLISARELRSGKLNTLYMLAYVSQFVRLDCSISKKKILHDELTQKFRVIKRELKHIPPMECRFSSLLDPIPNPKHAHSIPTNLASEIKEVYLKRLNASNGCDKKPLPEDERSSDWTDFASIKSNFDHGPTKMAAPTKMGLAPTARKIKMATMKTNQDGGIVKADPTLCSDTNGPKEIRQFVLVDYIPAILPVSQRKAFTFAIAKSPTMPFKNDSLLIWIHPSANSKVNKYPGKIETSDAPIDPKILKNVTIPTSVDKDDLLDREKFDLYLMSFTIQEIGEHRLQLLMNGKEIYPLKDGGSEREAMTFKAYDISKVTHQTLPYCIRDLLTTIQICAKDSGPGKLEVLINNGATKSTIRSLGSKIFAVDFIPTAVLQLQATPHTLPQPCPEYTQVIEIRFNGDQIPQSPFLSPLLDMGKFTYHGKGLGPAIKIKTPMEFIIETHQSAVRAEHIKVCILPIASSVHPTPRQDLSPVIAEIIENLIDNSKPIGPSLTIRYSLPRVGFYTLSISIMDPSMANALDDSGFKTGGDTKGHSFITLPFTQLQSRGAITNDKHPTKVVLKAFDPKAICLSDPNLLSKTIEISERGEPFSFNIQIEGSAGEGHLELAVDGGTIPNKVHLLPLTQADQPTQTPHLKMCKVSFAPISPSHTIEVKFNGYPIPQSPFILKFALPPKCDNASETSVLPQESSISKIGNPESGSSEVPTFLKFVLDQDEYTASGVTQIARSEITVGRPFSCRIITNETNESALLTTLVACDCPNTNSDNEVEVNFSKTDLEAVDHVEYQSELTLPHVGNYELCVRLSSPNIGVRLIIKASKKFMFPTTEDLIMDRFGFVDEPYGIQVDMLHEGINMQCFLVNYADQTVPVEGILIEPNQNSLKPIMKFNPLNLGIHHLRIIVNEEIKDYPTDIYIFPSPRVNKLPASVTNNFYDKNTIDPSFFFAESDFLEHICNETPPTIENNVLVFEVGKVYKFVSKVLPFLEYLPIRASLISGSLEQKVPSPNVELEILNSSINLTIKPNIPGSYALVIETSGRALSRLHVQVIDVASIIYLKDEWSDKTLDERAPYYLQVDLSRSGGIGPLNLELSPVECEDDLVMFSDRDSFDALPINEPQGCVNASTYFNYEISYLPSDIVDIELRIICQRSHHNSDSTPKAYVLTLKGWPLGSVKPIFALSKVFNLKVHGSGKRSQHAEPTKGELGNDYLEIVPGYGSLYDPPDKGDKPGHLPSLLMARAFRPTYFLVRLLRPTRDYTDGGDCLACQITGPDRTELSFNLRERDGGGGRVMALEFVPCHTGPYQVTLEPRRYGASDVTPRRPMTFGFTTYDVKKIVTSFTTDGGLDSVSPRLTSVPPLLLNQALYIEVDCSKSGGLGALEVRIVNSSDPEMESLPFNLETLETERKYLITFVPTLWAPSYEIHLNLNKDPLSGSPFNATFSQTSITDSKESLTRLDCSDILPIKYIDSVTNSYSDHNSVTKNALFSMPESSPIPFYQAQLELKASDKTVSSPTQTPRLLSTEIYSGKDADWEPFIDSQLPLETVLGRALNFSVTLPESWFMRGEENEGGIISNVLMNVDHKMDADNDVVLCQGCKRNVINVSCKPGQPGPYVFTFEPKVIFPGLTQATTSSIRRVVHVFGADFKSQAKHTAYSIHQATGSDKVKRGLPFIFRVFGPNILSPFDVKIYGRVYPDNYESENMHFTITQNADFGLDVIFIPGDIGELNVHVKVDGNDITGSPIIYKVYDPSKIVVQNLKYGFLWNSKDSWFLIDAQDAGIGDLELTVSANGTKIPNYVQLFEKICKPNSLKHQNFIGEAPKKTIFKVTFKPTTTDEHSIDIRFNGEPIVGSPFVCFIIDPGQFDLSGPNLVFAEYEKLNRFFIDMPKHYIDRLDITEMKPQITLFSSHKKVNPGSNIYKDNDRMVVEFRPIVVGAYEIVIELLDVPILARRGRDCCHVYNANFVHVSKLKERVKINKEYKISVDTFKAGAGHLKILMYAHVLANGTGPSGGIFGGSGMSLISVPVTLCPLFSSERKEMAHPETKYYEACYVTQTPGKHSIEITFNDTLIKGSPFIIEAEKGKAIVWGPGLCSFPLEHIPAYFQIDLKQAYSDHGIFSSRKKGKKLEVIISDPFGTIIPWKYREDQGSNSEASYNNYLTPKGSSNPFTIEYYPLHPGTHSISLRYGNNVSIGSSPYSVTIYGKDLKSQAVGESSKSSDSRGHPSPIQATEVGYVGEVYSVDIEVPSSFPSKHPQVTIKMMREKRIKSPDFLRKLSPPPNATVADGIASPKGMEVSYTLGRTGTKGRYQASFTPTQVRPHIVTATLDGVLLPGFPLEVRIERTPKANNSLSPLSPTSDPELRSIRPKAHTRKSAPSLLGNPLLSSYATGPGLYSASVNETASFTLHDIADLEEIDVIITGPNNSLVPCKCYHQQNGDYKVEYQPDLIGKYQIDISIGNSKVDGSPYFCNIFNASKIVLSSLPPSPFKLPLGEELTFYANCCEAGESEFNVQVQMVEPSAKRPTDMDHTCQIKRCPNTNGDGCSYQIVFKPTRLGDHQICPTYGGRMILGNPIDCKVEQRTELAIRATGDGLRKGIEGQVCRFKVFIDGYDVHTNDSLPQLTVNIEGPNSLPDVTVHSHDNGAFSVTYTPQEIGIFKILIQQSSLKLGPYTAQICNPHKVKVITSEDFGIMLQMGVEKNITVDGSLAGPGSLSVEIQVLTMGDSRLIEKPCKMEHLPTNANYYIVFTPTHEGQYYVHLKWNGYSLPCSPLMGKCQEPIQVANGINNYVHNGSQALMSAIERLLSTPPSDTSFDLCKITGTGLGPRIIPNKAYQLCLDFTSLHKEILARVSGDEVKGAINSMDHILDPIIKLIPAAGGRHTVHVACSSITYPIYKYSYEVISPGEYKLVVAIKRQHTSCAIFQRSDDTDHDFNLISLPGSPFHIVCYDLFPSPELSGGDRSHGLAGAGSKNAYSNGSDQDNGGDIYASNASKVKVFGLGIKSGVLAHFQSQFTIDTKGACAGQLTVKIRGPKSAFHVNMRRDSMRERVIHCQYDPTEPGDYHVHVKWSGHHVPGSPFTVIIYDTFQELQKSQNILSAPQNPTEYPAPKTKNNDTTNGSPTLTSKCSTNLGTNKCLRGFTTLSYQDWRKL